MAVSPSAWAGGGAVETTQRLRRSREGHDEQAAGRCFWRFLQRCGPRRCLVRASEASGPRLAADAAHRQDGRQHAPYRFQCPWISVLHAFSGFAH